MPLNFEKVETASCFELVRPSFRQSVFASVTKIKLQF